MGYWYCKAKIYEDAEREITKNGLFGEKTVTESYQKESIIEGKVLGINYEGFYNAISVVVKEGKNPVIKEAFYECDINENDEEDGEYDKVIELKWID